MQQAISLENHPFYKMNGLGNDFVILDIRSVGRRPTPEEVRSIANRATGIGCDQLITIESRSNADARLSIFNADGGEVEACGNATRCVAWILLQNTENERLCFSTPGGTLYAWSAGENNISVDMGKPRLDWEDIPLSERMSTNCVDVKLGPIDNPVLHSASAVNMGNPHCIYFVDDVMAHDLEGIGPLVEGHMMFPERTNVELAQIRSPKDIRVRVWERGVGVTKACGTGACAVVVAAVRRKLSARIANVELDGGVLGIEWKEANDHVIMTGGIEMEFEGELSPALFE